MTRFLMIIFFSYAGYLPVHHFGPFMVISSAHRESQPLYEGVYVVRGYGERLYYLTWVAA
jgi:hypothetical protein